MRTMNRILCPIDLSDITGHTASCAVMMARRYKARITALYISNPLVVPSAAFAVLGPAPLPILTDDELKDTRHLIIREFSNAGAPDIDVVVDSGAVAGRITQLAASLPADLVVIGTHGAGGFQHLVLGSVTERVLRQAACPVLTVPPRARSTASLPFSRVLCPVDFSASSRAALDFAFTMAGDNGAALTVLHVFEWPAEGESLLYRPMNVPEFKRMVEQDAAKTLRAFVAHPPAGCRPASRIAHGKAYREILAVAAEEAADLIVMGVQGRNALDLMLFGSTTNQVIRLATCPVLTVRC